MRIKANSPITLIVAIVVIIATGILFASISVVSKGITQGSEKSLDIKRYRNEPLELVDLKVSEQPVKGNIQVKRRINGEGLDSVKFQDKDEWFKRVKVKLRNVSDKPIVSITAYLYFRPSIPGPFYRVDLTPSKQLQNQALQPGEEVALTVSDQSWSQTEEILKRYGVNANNSTVSFSIDFVMFNDGRLWHRGGMIQQVPNNPRRWEPENKPTNNKPPSSRLDHAAKSYNVGLFNLTMPPPQSATCTNDNNSFDATACPIPGAYCYTLIMLGAHLAKPIEPEALVSAMSTWHFHES